MSPMTLVNAFFNAGPAALVAKATAVLVAAAIVTLLLPRASAAIRHLIWLTALAGCAALALFSPVAPPLVVPLPGADERALFLNDAPLRPAAALSSTRAFTALRSMPAREVPVSSIVRRTSSAPTWMEVYGGSLFVVVWAIGCLVVLLRCVVGHVAIARIVRRASPVTSPEWDASLIAAMVDAGAQRTVTLLISDDLSAPVTTGFVHPVILIPCSAESWDAERRIVVLVHEVAHIARFDYAGQLVATLAGALFWFHPLAWLATAKLRAEAENAADDRVLAAGTTGVAYAGHLLDLARQESGMPLSAAVAVGMVRASRLERRFRAMLDSTRSRAALPPRLQAVATSLTLAAMIPLAGARTTIVPGAHPHRVSIAGAQTAIAIASTSTSTSTATSSVTTIALAQPAAARPAASGDSTFETTIDAASGERLTVDLQTGGSVVVHGWDEPRIRMRARLGGRDWRGVRVALERFGRGVRLQSRFFETTPNWSTESSFELWVPRHMDIDLSSLGGSLAINDVTGEFRGHSGGGGITIEGAMGSATLTTGGGDVYVANSTLAGTVSTGGGEVIISNVLGGLTGSSGSGPVISSGDAVTSTRARRDVGFGSSISTTTVSRSDATADGMSTATSGVTRGVGRGVGFGDVRGVDGSMTVTNGSTYTVTDGVRRGLATANTSVGVGEGLGSYSYTMAGGDITLDKVPGGGRVYTGGGRVYIGSSGGSLNVSTGGGDIELPQMGGDATVWTGAGAITITVVNTDGTEHSMDVFTGHGRVVLELPAKLDATIELESAYTDNFGRKTGIESDLAFTRSETQAWDDRDGSPRKFVRARGVVGNGHGLIRVRTVNGDIVVHQR